MINTMNEKCPTKNAAANGVLMTKRDDDTLRTDYLFRVSLKALICDDDGRILVVKEHGRPFWDLPGGGMDFGETTEQALARELREEVGYSGAFRYQPFFVADPIYVGSINAYQAMIYCRVWLDNLEVSLGADGDAMKFAHPDELKNSGYRPTDTVLQAYADWHKLQASIN